jgi:response regulator RpfG family c-di-GMP phosphodiesterase
LLGPLAVGGFEQVIDDDDAGAAQICSMRSKRANSISSRSTIRSGIDLASRLRNPDIDTPINLITGYPDENILGKAAAAGIHHVLLKPRLEESLVSRMRHAIQASHPLSR